MSTLPPLPESDSEEISSPEPSPHRGPTRTRFRNIDESKVDLEDLTSSPDSEGSIDSSMDAGSASPPADADPGSPDRHMETSDTKGSEKRSRDSASPPKEVKRGRAQPHPTAQSPQQLTPVINLDDIQGSPLSDPDSDSPLPQDAPPATHVDPDPPPELLPDQIEFIRQIQVLRDKETTQPEPPSISIIPITQHKASKQLKQILTQLPPDLTTIATTPYQSPNQANAAHLQLFALILCIACQSRSTATTTPSDLPLTAITFIIQRLLKNQFDFSAEENLLSPNEASALRSGLCRFACSTPHKIFPATSHQKTIRARPITRLWKACVDCLGHQYTLTKGPYQPKLESFFQGLRPNTNLKTKAAPPKPPPKPIPSTTKTTASRTKTSTARRTPGKASAKTTAKATLHPGELGPTDRSPNRNKPTSSTPASPTQLNPNNNEEFPPLSPTRTKPKAPPHLHRKHHISFADATSKPSPATPTGAPPGPSPTPTLTTLGHTRSPRRSHPSPHAPTNTPQPHSVSQSPPLPTTTPPTQTTDTTPHPPPPPAPEPDPPAQASDQARHTLLQAQDNPTPHAATPTPPPKKPSAFDQLMASSRLTKGGTTQDPRTHKLRVQLCLVIPQMEGKEVHAFVKEKLESLIENCQYLDEHFAILPWHPHNQTKFPPLASPAEVPSNFLDLRPYLSLINPAPNKLWYVALYWAGSTDLLDFCSGPSSGIAYFWESLSGSVLTGGTSNPKLEHKRSWCKAQDIQESTSSSTVGFLVGTCEATDSKSLYTQIHPALQKKFRQHHPEKGKLLWALTPRHYRGMSTSTTGNRTWPLKDNVPIIVICDDSHISFLVPALHLLFNKSEYGKKERNFRFNAEPKYSLSTRMQDYHAQLNAKHQTFMGCLDRPIPTSYIDSLDTPHTLDDGDTISLRQFVMQLTYPVLPNLDDNGNPCDCDEDGNIRVDDKGQPLPATKLFHDVNKTVYGREASAEHNFLTLKDRSTYAARVVAALPALVFQKLGVLPNKWFTSTGRQMKDDIYFLTDEDGNWTGDWTNQADEDLDDILADDMGFGAHSAFAFEGLDLLTQQTGHDMPVARPADDLTVDTAKVSAGSLHPLHHSHTESQADQLLHHTQVTLDTQNPPQPAPPPDPSPSPDWASVEVPPSGPSGHPHTSADPADTTQQTGSATYAGDPAGHPRMTGAVE